MSRLLLLGAMVVSLIVPVGAITLGARSSGKSDQEAACAKSHNLALLRQREADAEIPLSGLKVQADDDQSAYRGFLDAHPESRLKATDYSTYLGLRSSSQQSVAAYNAQVGVYNASINAVNTVISECKR